MVDPVAGEIAKRKYASGRLHIEVELQTPLQSLTSWPHAALDDAFVNRRRVAETGLMPNRVVG
jgi:hypothetical protein